jgi:hypothetical protein
MAVREMAVKVRGVSPLLMNRDDLRMLDPEKYSKRRGEEYIDMEERIWRDKAHFESTGGDNPKAVLRDVWVKRSLLASQKQSGCPIAPPGSRKKTDSLRNYFVSGVLIHDSHIILDGKPVTKKDLVPFKAMVRPQKTGGKICCIRPMIPTGWTATIKIIITDEAIKNEDIIKCLEWVGVYNGIGDWRVERGGQFGRFEVFK